MKKSTIILVLALFPILLNAQEIQKELRPFSKIIASPRINVILQKGDKEEIRLVYDDVNKENINIEVKGKTLLVYLDDARRVEKTIRHNHHGTKHGIYQGATLTAYITYQKLESLEIRGNQELTCNDAISADKFKLKAYGENDITFASLDTEFFKASLYGENDLTINAGQAIEQKYRLFGENKIDTRAMKSAYTSTSIFGEGRLRINSTEEVVVNAFGEPRIDVNGGGHVNRRLIFGKAQISNR
jgi:hypothetical protein